jgi:shikimate dehydrogenase
MVSAREPDKIAEMIADKDVIIQATSLGMEGRSEDYKDLSFLANAKRGALACDLVYAPSQTTFLREARARGLKGVNGFGMLKRQAEFAAKIFQESR